MIDIHTHTYYSPDSMTPIRKNIEAAIDKGLSLLVTSDHIDHYADPNHPLLTHFNTEKYFNELRSLQDEYKDKIQLLIAVEIGLQPDACQWNDEFIKSHDFDMAIGSVHCVGHEDVARNRRELLKNPTDWVDRYYEEMLESVKHTHNFHILGHIDYIDRYFADRSLIPNYNRYWEIIEAILREIIRTDRGIEVNTGGMRRKLGYNNPKDEIIKMYYDLGGRIIAPSSDAHRPEDIGWGIKEVESLLLDIGFDHMTIFKDKKPVEIPLT